MATKPTGDGKFFSNNSTKSENQELKDELNSTDKSKVINAVKKVIANMTVGKDVSALFTDVVREMQTENVELKKLIYLYLINYARGQPDKAIMVVNTFQRDAEHENPLLRALAIRTMGCIRVDNIADHLCEPLAKALKDQDAYVRKTAALCVAKLYDINPELVEEQGFLDTLRSLIADSNSMVVSNAVAALAEIAEISGKDVMKVNENLLNKLMAALTECNEWGQVFILDTLGKYEPNQMQAEMVIERVVPRLKHSNAAVSLSAVKVIVKCLNYTNNETTIQRTIQEKLPPPLITILSEQRPELQYVTLRNIGLILQKYPTMLQNAAKHFYCKYNDPIFVKMEKLEIMIQLANVKNIDKILSEFKEYATEVDVEFVRKAVMAIGRCAVKIDKATDRCIKTLLELIESKVNYVVQEAVVVIKDIFRKYPNQYESIISTLCQNLDSLDEPAAKASMIWIIGEYSDRIDASPDLLQNFVETWDDEVVEVQLALLTAVVKLFLKRPADSKELVTTVLNLATDNSDNPDLRDRGYVYWRLLASDSPEQAHAVVLGPKPVISEDSFSLDPELLDGLINNLVSLASIYQKPAESFVLGGKKAFTLKSTDKKKEKGSDSESSDGESGKESGSDSDSSSSDSDSDSKSGSDSGSDSSSGSDSDDSKANKDTKTDTKTAKKNDKNSSNSNTNQINPTNFVWCLHLIRVTA